MSPEEKRARRRERDRAAYARDPEKFRKLEFESLSCCKGLLDSLRCVRFATASQSNTHLCARSGSTSFFALEYNPTRYAPIWVSYRIANSFGAGGCASMTRKRMQCHFTVENVEACIEAPKPKPKPEDPFHVDPTLAEKKIKRLGTDDFSGTRHDRGHMAPNNAFSWHACGAYKTFTMANMAAQWDDLNRILWAKLEAQMLYWGVNEGPIIVTTGPISRRFPSERFQAIQNGTVDPGRFSKPGTFLTKTPSGAATPKTIPRPTGFYMIAFKSGEGSQPDRAIAFLVPHTEQKELSFWSFVSTVNLVEDTSGLQFSLGDATKGWPDLGYWRAQERRLPSGWDVRQGCSEQGDVPGWNADRPLAERVAMCRSVEAIN